MELALLAVWCFLVALGGRLSEQQLIRSVGVVLLVAAASMVVEAIVR